MRARKERRPPWRTSLRRLSCSGTRRRACSRRSGPRHSSRQRCKRPTHPRRARCVGPSSRHCGGLESTAVPRNWPPSSVIILTLPRAGWPGPWRPCASHIRSRRRIGPIRRSPADAGLPGRSPADARLPEGRAGRRKRTCARRPDRRRPRHRDGDVTATMEGTMTSATHSTLVTGPTWPCCKAWAQSRVPVMPNPTSAQVVGGRGL